MSLSNAAAFVATSGLRWMSMMVVASVPWAQRIWALPFLTILTASERYHQARGQQHKQLTDWASQMIRQVRRWLPDRQVVVVADSTYAALELVAACPRLSPAVTMVARRRLDAALYDPAPPRTPGQRGARRKKGTRQPTLACRAEAPPTRWEEITVRWYGQSTRVVKIATGTAVWYHSRLPVVPLRRVIITDPVGTFVPQALLSTDVALPARRIVEWLVWHWQLDVPFEEARAHLGIETQRQWSELAILRTTLALLGLFSLVTLLAHQVLQECDLSVRSAAWYTKSVPTFSDRLALVRQQLWPVQISWLSTGEQETITSPKALFEHLADTLAFAD